ncbi:MAG: hypothetical protein ACTTJ9_00525 [Segatella oris]
MRRLKQENYNPGTTPYFVNNITLFLTLPSETFYEKAGEENSSYSAILGE